MKLLNHEGDIVASANKPGVYILTDNPSAARRDFGLNRKARGDAASKKKKRRQPNK